MMPINRELTLTISAFFSFILLISGIFLFNYLNDEINFYKELDKTLISAAKGQTLILPSNIHDKAIHHDITDEEDQKNIALLSRLAKTLNVKYIYTLVTKKDQIYFTASSAVKEDWLNNKVTYFNDHYDDAPSSAMRAFTTKQIVFDEYHDKWGDFRSVFIPLYSPSGLLYVAAADIPIDDIQAKLSSIKQRYVLSIFLILLVGIPLILWRYNVLYHKLTQEIKINIYQDHLMSQQAAAASMGEMVGMIAHQWRQPLNAISAAVIKVNVLNEMGTLSSEELKTTFKFIQDMTQKMSVTISDFMEFTKTDRGKELFFIKDIANDVIKIIAAQLRTLNIAVLIDIKDGIRIEGYKNELAHVLLNLLSNARDAFDNKEISDKTISIRAYEDSETITIEVSDNAGGIHSSILPKIFDPSFSTKPTGKGTGLGLHLSKKIIEEHFNGKIIATNINGGATFTILLSKPIPINEPQIV